MTRFPPVDGFAVGGHLIEDVSDDLDVCPTAGPPAELPQLVGSSVVVVDGLVDGVGVDLANAVAVDRGRNVLDGSAMECVHAARRSAFVPTAGRYRQAPAVRRDQSALGASTVSVLGALRCDSSRGQAIDGVFLALADGQNVACRGVDLAVDEAEPLRSLASDVELHPGQSGQVTTDASVTEQFAGHPPMGEIIEDRLYRGECGRLDRVHSRKVGSDAQAEGERVGGTRLRAIAHTLRPARSRSRTSVTSARVSRRP